MILSLLLRNWRLVAVGLAALAILATVWAGHAYVKRLQDKVESLQISLAYERTARQTAEATIAQMKIAAAKTQADIYQLEADHRQDQENWLATLKLIDDLEDCLPADAAESSAASPSTPPVKSSNDQVDRLNRANADVNRMLERIGK
jgi:hypothetical protein